MSIYYEYEVDYWDEIDEENAVRRGVTCADDLHEAMENICLFYGEDNINNLLIFRLEGSKVYEFNYDGNHFTLN